jgi:hypothetical protein
MEPLVTIVMTSNYKTLGDWDQKEIDWLLLNMDWRIVSRRKGVPPSGGSLEIGNLRALCATESGCAVPPSGGSLEIGNFAVNRSVGH